MEIYSYSSIVSYLYKWYNKSWWLSCHSLASNIRSGLCSKSLLSERLYGCGMWSSWWSEWVSWHICSIIIERFLLTFSIHPRYKHDVAYRLSRAGLGVAYNQSVEYLGPIPKAIDYEPGNPTVNIVYGSVSSIDQRSSSGFDVSDFCFHHTQLTRSALFRFVVVELIV